MRKSKARMRLVADRGLQRSDVAVINFRAERTDNGEEVMGADRKGMQLDTGTPEETLNLPGAYGMPTSGRYGHTPSILVAKTLSLRHSWMDCMAVVCMLMI